jgi:signal transduction histidine kinase
LMNKIPGSIFAAATIILLLTLVKLTPALAQSVDSSSPEPVILTDGQGKYPLGLYLQLLEDPGGKLTIEDVSSAQYDAKFSPSRVEVPNYGYTDSAYWVRFHLKNETSRMDQWLLELAFSNMQYVDLYLPSRAGDGYTVKQAGILRLFNSRDVPDRNIVFKLTLPPQAEQTIYMRFRNDPSMTLPLILWIPEAYFQNYAESQWLYGFFYGALLIILIYHLSVLYSIREATYLYYVFFLASLILTFAGYDAIAAQYLWPSLPAFNRLATYFFFSLTMGTTLLFTDSFLELKTHNPGIHRLFQIGLVVWGLVLLLLPFVSTHTLVVWFAPYGVLSLALAGIAGVVALQQGYLPARFFLFSWLGFFTGMLILLLVREGVVPSTAFTENAVRFGILWLAAFWSLSLADRVNLLKSEMEKANQALKSSEHQLSQILEGLPLAVVMYGKDRKPGYGNKRTYDILSDSSRGIRPDLSAGRTLDMAIDYYSLKKEGTDQAYPLEKFPIQKALNGVPASADDIEADFGDKRLSLEMWASPVRDENGTVESAIVAFQDITQRKQAEAELVGYRHELESLVEERTTDLNEANQKLELRLGWLSAVNKVHDAITGTSSLEGVYTELSDEILRLLGAELVFVHRWDGPGEPLTTLSHSAEMKGPHDIDFVKALFQKESRLRQEIELGNNVTDPMELTASLAELFDEHIPKHELPGFVFVPIKTGLTVVGVLGVAAAAASQNLIREESDLVERMALDLASLMEGALLLDQAVVLATVQERNRLARELHDSVTQTLFTASVLAEATPHIWEKDAGIGRQNLAKLSRLIRGALAEMRSMLIELRMGDLHRQTLEQLLVTLVDGAQARSQAFITLSVPEDLPKLPEKIVICFYRVAREAINNATVHSGAAWIDVALAEEQGRLALRIQDDGCGFDPDLIPSGHLGISIMGERAEEIGATLLLQTSPGHGTLIGIAWTNPAGESIKND